METINNITLFLTQLWDDLTHLPELLTENPSHFWWIVGTLAALVLLILFLILHGAARRKRRREAERQKQTTRTFIRINDPKEQNDRGGAILLPLKERIIACKDQLNRDTARRIIMRAPGTLADIVAAYEHCSPGVQRDLAQLVRESRMLESYSLRLNEEGCPLGVLVDAWKYFADPTALRGFVELLGHRDEQVQMNAVKILSAIQEPKALSLLVPALVRPDRYVTARVADVFLSMPTQSAPLLAYMLPEMGDQQKLQMLDIIAQTGAEFPLENVVACLKSRDYHIRSAACLALGSGRMTAPVPQLILAASDRQWQVRAAAAKALGQIGDMRALATLHSLAKDTEGWVAAAARESLSMYDNFS